MSTTEIQRKDAIANNLAGVITRIDKACICAKRSLSEVTLMAVTKYASSQDVRLLLDTGLIKVVGENKVQDTEHRWINGDLSAYRNKVSLHCIGHLQTNKVKQALSTFDSIDSVDSLKLANAVNRHSAKINKITPVLLQIKLTDSVTQTGINPKEVSQLLKETESMSNIAVYGYMAIAPNTDNREEIVKAFTLAKSLFDKDFTVVARKNKLGIKPVLSLGMSEDFEEAVMSGSTMPRIGGALFK